MIIVRNRDLRDRALQLVADIRPDPERPMEVIVRPHREKRTLEQLSYLFGVVYEHIRYHLAESGLTDEIYSAEDIHEYLARKFMPTKAVQVGRDAVTRRWSAADAPKKELSEHIEHCIRWAAEMGCEVPPPKAREEVA